MQKIQKFFMFVLVLAASFFTSCDDNSNSSNNNNTPASGKWKITYFFDKKDETSNFSGYVFDFNSNGSLTATNGSQSWSGTWSTGIDDSKDKFLISFSVAVPSSLSDLQEDWVIIQMDDALMHLEHTSGGNGDTDIVKFEKD